KKHARLDDGSASQRQLMRPMPRIARNAPSQALAAGRSPFQIHSIGRTRAGGVGDNVGMMPAAPRLCAAIREEMPKPVPMKAEATQMAMAVRSLPALGERAAGRTAKARKNTAPIPERTAMAVKGSAPEAMTGRAKRLPNAWPRAVTSPRAMPGSKGPASAGL